LVDSLASQGDGLKEFGEMEGNTLLDTIILLDP
jgi:hypothetical protein